MNKYKIIALEERILLDAAVAHDVAAAAAHAGEIQPIAVVPTHLANPHHIHQLASEGIMVVTHDVKQESPPVESHDSSIKSDSHQTEHGLKGSPDKLNENRESTDITKISHPENKSLNENLGVSNENAGVSKPLNNEKIFDISDKNAQDHASYKDHQQLHRPNPQIHSEHESQASPKQSDFGRAPALPEIKLDSSQLNVSNLDLEAAKTHAKSDGAMSTQPHHSSDTSISKHNIDYSTQDPQTVGNDHPLDTTSNIHLGWIVHPQNIQSEAVTTDSHALTSDKDAHAQNSNIQLPHPASSSIAADGANMYAPATQAFGNINNALTSSLSTQTHISANANTLATTSSLAAPGLISSNQSNAISPVSVSPLSTSPTPTLQSAVQNSSSSTTLNSSQTVSLQTQSAPNHSEDNNPSITIGPSPVVLEDSGTVTLQHWATIINSESNQSGNSAITITIANDNNSLFTSNGQPTLSSNGTLTFTPAPNANGTSNVTLSIQINGNEHNNPVIIPVTFTFTITVVPVNDSPSFSFTSTDPTQTVLENAPAQTVSGFVSGIAGPANESGQTLSYNVSNSNNALFSVQPTISADGTLTYTLANNANGNATVSVLIHDNGGTANGGVDTSTVQTFEIHVTPVNQVPFFSFTSTDPTQTVLENAVPQTVTDFVSGNTGAVNESGQTLSYSVSNDNNALFSVQPAISADGTLTYTLAKNANGNATVSVLIHDNGGTANGGVDTSTVQTFEIHVTPVNQVPSFSFTSTDPTQTVLENAAPQTVTGFVSGNAGAINESGQTLSYSVSNDNNALFSVQPAISADGTLTYTLANNANGTATVSVQIQDNGGTANGGVDTSAVQTFVINVTPVNQAPSFSFTTTDPTQNVLENAAPQTVTGFVSGNAGAINESGQTLSYSVSNDNNALFSVQPTISADGTLTYTLAPNANGTATVSVQIHDNGGTTNGGADTSSVQTFVINVTYVNQAPSFSLLSNSNLTVAENSPPQSVANFANNINVGPGNPTSETVNFIVSTNNPSLFSVAPSISPDGTLVYTLAPNVSGTATVTVQIHDSGGTANGGIDTSTPQTFTITVTPTATASAPSVSNNTSTTVSTTATASASALTTSSSNITAKDTHAAGGSAQFIQNENINSSSQAGLNLFELSANERFSPTQDNNQIQYNLNTRKAESEAIKFSGLGAEQHKPLQQPEIFWNSNLKDNNIHAIATPAAIATTFSATDMNSLKLQKRADFGAIMNIQLAGLNATIMGNPVTWKEGGNVIIHVSLKKQPNAKVIAHFKISDEKLATVKPARIEFNPANWYIEQEVTVIGLDGKPGTVNNDESISGGIQYELIILPLESSDSSYRELESANITLWALDKSPYGN